MGRDQPFVVHLIEAGIGGPQCSQARMRGLVLDLRIRAGDDFEPPDKWRHSRTLDEQGKEHDAKRHDLQQLRIGAEGYWQTEDQG